MKKFIFFLFSIFNLHIIKSMGVNSSHIQNNDHVYIHFGMDYKHGVVKNIKTKKQDGKTIKQYDVYWRNKYGAIVNALIKDTHISKVKISIGSNVRILLYNENNTIKYYNGTVMNIVNNEKNIVYHIWNHHSELWYKITPDCINTILDLK